MAIGQFYAIYVRRLSAHSSTLLQVVMKSSAHAFRSFLSGRFHIAQPHPDLSSSTSADQQNNTYRPSSSSPPSQPSPNLKATTAMIPFQIQHIPSHIARSSYDKSGPSRNGAPLSSAPMTRLQRPVSPCSLSNLSQSTDHLMAIEPDVETHVRR